MKKPTCRCINSGYQGEDFFEVEDRITVECTAYGRCGNRNYDVEVNLNFCPRCGSPYEEVK